MVIGCISSEVVRREREEGGFVYYISKSNSKGILQSKGTPV